MTTTAGQNLWKGIAEGGEGEFPRVVVVEEEGFSVQAEVNGASAHGCSLEKLTARGRPVSPGTDGLRRRAESLAGHLPGLPERLKVHEVDEAHGEAILRSRPEEMRGKRYSEVRVRGDGEVSVERFRYLPESTARERIPQAFTPEGLERLVEELGRNLKPSSLPGSGPGEFKKYEQE